MKNKKIGLWLNIVTICLSLCAIAVGVYSAKQTKLSISGSIGFVAYSNANVECSVVGAKNSSGTVATSSSPFYLTPNGIETNSNNKTIKMVQNTPPLSLNGLSFTYDSSTKKPIPIVITFNIINTTTTETIVADLNIDNLVTKNITSTVDNFVQIIRHSGDSLGGDSDQSVIGSATISLTLTLKENVDTENAVSGNMQLNIQAPMDTTGFEVDVDPSDEYYLKTVPQAGTNKELVIPAYVYSDNCYKKVTSIKNGIEFETPITNISSYTSVVVSNGIESIYSIGGNLTSVYLPASVIYIAWWSGSVNNITFSNRLKTIGAHVVDSFKQANITIPSSVTYISQQDNVSFANSVESVTFEDPTGWYYDDVTYSSGQFIHEEKLLDLSDPTKNAQLFSSTINFDSSLRGWSKEG